MLLLESDVLIDLLRRYPPARQWLAGLSELPAVPGFVAMELMQGCASAVELREVERLLAHLPVIWPGEEVCSVAAAEFGRRRLRYGIGPLDALIGGCALGLGATLCTFNDRHFRCISGLSLERPYKKRATQPL